MKTRGASLEVIIPNRSQCEWRELLMWLDAHVGRRGVDWEMMMADEVGDRWLAMFNDGERMALFKLTWM